MSFGWTCVPVLTRLRTIPGGSPIVSKEQIASRTHIGTKTVSIMPARRIYGGQSSLIWAIVMVHQDVVDRHIIIICEAEEVYAPTALGIRRKARSVGSDTAPLRTSTTGNKILIIK